MRYELNESGDNGENISQENFDTIQESDVENELQIKEAVERLSNIAELQPDVWDQLDSDQRLGVLQLVENNLAEVQGRPSVGITPIELPANAFGQFDGTQIQINQDHLTGNSIDVREMIDTIVHEGRHAYQSYAIEHPGFHSDSDQVQSWADNFQPENYLTVEQYGQEMYQNQPIEADAWQ